MIIRNLVLQMSLIISATVVINSAKAQTFEWVNSFGSTGVDQGLGIAVDLAGNVYTTGLFYGTVDFDPGVATVNLTAVGAIDVFVKKTDMSGNLIWVKSFGGNSDDIGYSIAVDQAGNVYTSGRFAETVDFDPGTGTDSHTSAGGTDYFIQKLDPSGDFVWAKTFGGTNSDIAYTVTVDPFGNVITAGRFDGTVDFDPGAGTSNLSSAGDFDAFIQKLNSDGDLIWAKSFGGAAMDIVFSVKTDNGGHVYSIGRFDGTADFDPGAGTDSHTSNGSTDIFVVKLDDTGNFLWAKTFGGSSIDIGSSIYVDAGSNVYTTGHFKDTADFDPGAGTVNYISKGDYDVFIQKLDPSGNFLWAKSFGNPTGDYSLAITGDLSGNVYTAGSFGGTVDFDPGVGTVNITSEGFDDIFIHKLDPAGEFVWARTIGGANYEKARDLAVDLSGSIYTIGDYQMTVDFDPGIGIANETALGGSDIFEHKMSVCTNTSGTDTRIECSPYTWIDGNSYTTSNNTATYNIVAGAVNGCDSIVTLDLTILNPATGTDTRTECSPYTWIDGNTYTANNNTATYAFVGASANGCDSVVTLDLTILNSAMGTDVITACNSYTWIDGNTYTASNNTATYNFVGAAANGCDSLVALDLTINNVSEITTNTSGIMISSNNILADYQWLDCNNNYAVITGETNASFTPSANGSYAVELTENGCVDTSACVIISSVGVIENSFQEEFILYPNPTDSQFTVQFNSIQENLEMTIMDISGKLIEQKNYSLVESIEFETGLVEGIYIIELTGVGEQKALLKLVKQ